MKHLSHCLYDTTPVYSYTHENDFYKSIVLITLAGLPPTTTLLGTSFVTTAPEVITALSPIETPGLIIAPPPTQTLLPILLVFHILYQSFVLLDVKGA